MRRGDRGATLVEASVALALGLAIVLAASHVWVEARRVVAATDAALAREQTARVVLDRLVADLRLAGHGVDPDGDPARPDEALEGAWDDAVALRADGDEGGADADTPEAALAAGGPFDTVSTGNDEVVIWALQRQGGGTRTFEADVGGLVRDGVVERVDVGRVPAAPVDAGATLYRLTLDPDVADPSASGFIDRVPVADGIRSLRFDYLDAAGAPLPAPGGAESAAADRRAVRSIRVTLELAGASPGNHVAEVALVNAAGVPPAAR